MKHYLVVVMDDTGKALEHSVVGDDKLRAKLEELIFFDREHSEERNDAMDAYVSQAEDEGRITFEGDPPIYVYETYADDAPVFDAQDVYRSLGYDSEKEPAVKHILDGARFMFDKLMKVGRK
jgi:hypothetical protein